MKAPIAAGREGNGCSAALSYIKAAAGLRPILLPMEQLAGVRQSNVTDPGADFVVQRPVIVVVDDDPAVCSSLKFSLELEGFAVKTYRDGPELLDSGEFGAGDCFVVDQRMPRMNGMELIEALRARQVTRPAILVISHQSPVLTARAAKAGIPIIEKPFLSNALVELIRKLCVASQA